MVLLKLSNESLSTLFLVGSLSGEDESFVVEGGFSSCTSDGGGGGNFCEESSRAAGGRRRAI